MKSASARLLGLGLALVVSGWLLPAGHATAGQVLDRVMKTKTLTMSSDPAYPPQSFLDDKNEFQGFDIDVGREIAKRLGAELKVVTPAWEVITAGKWGDRWDISVGSMTPTAERARVLVGIARHHRRLGVEALEVGADHAGFHDHVAVVHQHRHHAPRVHLLELRRQLLALGQAHVMVGPRLVLLGEHDADLLRADRDVVVIELEHRRLPGCAYPIVPRTRWHRLFR